MNILDGINSPADLKNLSRKELIELCGEIREYLIECCSQNPGHLGASLGTVELTVALHYVFNTPEDKLIWDVGHQAYTHKIITGRRELFLQNRKYKGISGFPKMSESTYDAFGTGHSSTSISAALGMAAAAKLKGENRQIVAVIGDGALTGGMAFEGLNNAGALKSDMLVILNDNGISIDKNESALHNYLLKISTSRTYNRFKNRLWEIIGTGRLRRMLQKISLSTKIAIFKRGTLFEALGFRYFGSIDGHNLDQLVLTLENLKEIKGPKLLHVITKKGKGFKAAEEDQVNWHAPGTFDIETGKRIKKPSLKSKYQDVFGETLLELARRDKRIVGITPAMPTGCSMNIMMREMPERTFDVGIAEQHAVTFSAGLAANGMLPVCNIYSSFMQRAYDSVIHDVATQKLKVIFCLDRAGIVGEDGATHHGAFDMACFRPVPNLAIAAPMNESELRNMLYSATLDKNPTTIIRYPRGEGEGVPWKGKEFEEVEYGKGRTIREGSDIAVVTIGTAGNPAEKAISELSETNPEISVAHYSMRFLKPFDYGLADTILGRFKKIITVEDGILKGGLFGELSEYATSKGADVKIIPLGIPDRFIEHGSVKQLLDECGYDSEHIKTAILDNADCPR